MADDDDEALGGLYEDGHWAWDNVNECLAFVSDHPARPQAQMQSSMKVITTSVEFRDDVDLIEQVRYRRRFQRKVLPGDPDVITLQDVKDIAIYTAPTSFLSPALINILHLPTTERFMRAMILYTAYYLQVSDIMAQRSWELEKKVRTPYSLVLENDLRDNIRDLRALAAKEFSSMLVGASDTKKYHHMGPTKKRKSLSDKDARLYETFIRIIIQIIWIAIGRKSFNQIEIEVNRMFKSDIFNTAEHSLKTGYSDKLSPEERFVLYGDCLRNDKKLKVCSPLMNEIFCDRPLDFHVMGIGVIAYEHMTNRQKYFWAAIAGKEELLVQMTVVLGIIGLPRAQFDAMLKPIQVGGQDKSKSGSCGPSRLVSTVRGSSSSKKSGLAAKVLYPEIVLPSKSSREYDIPPTFPDTPEKPNRVNEEQRQRWMIRYLKLSRHH